MRDPVRAMGLKLVPLIEDLGLFAVLAATVVAGAMEVWGMISARQVNITDLLLLFIYLEVISMVEIYWQAGKLPVRMPLYIAIGGSRPLLDARYRASDHAADIVHGRVHPAAGVLRAGGALRSHPPAVSGTPRQGRRQRVSLRYH